MALLLRSTRATFIISRFLYLTLKVWAEIDTYAIFGEGIIYACGVDL
jgi:hypothetical protein